MKQPTTDQQMNRATEANGTRSRLWRGVRWGLALLLAGLAAWLSVRQIHWAVLWDALVQTDLLALAWALGTVLATTLAKAARWHVLLRLCDARASGMRVLRVVLIGQMGNSFLPARLGDVGRAVLVGPQANGGIPAVLGTILVEKTLDGVMGFLILAGLALWTPLPSWLRGPVLAFSAFTGGLLALLALAAAKKGWAMRLFRRLIGWLPAHVQARIETLLAGFGLGLGLFRQPSIALLALACSALVWGLAALTNVATLAALDISAPGWSVWLVLVTGYVANFLPTVPAQIGVFEYTHMLALVAAGVGQESALAFGLILHLLVYGPPAVLGPMSMIWEGLSWSRLKEVQHKYLEQDGVPV
jgi:uncharacterized protein (TIRG00374 family)